MAEGVWGEGGGGGGGGGQLGGGIISNFHATSLVKATKDTFLYPWAEFAMGRVCNGPRL